MILWITSFLASFFVTFVLGKIAIPLLQRLKFGQEVRNDGPEKHLSKQGTPTMGGVTFVLGTLLVSWAACGLLLPGFDMEALAFASVCMLGFGLIGFLDDVIKIVKKQSMGLRPLQKILGQILLSVLIALWSQRLPGVDGSLLIPWSGYSWSLGWVYIPFIVVFCIAVVNCVNLTDGLDGLSASVTMIDVITYGGVYALLYFAVALRSPDAPAITQGLQTMQVFIAALAGALLAYLVFNVYPARMFMGDTGSFAMGGALCALAIYSRTALWIPIMGICYVASGASVILQVGSFKLRGGKRIFKMAPLHHHFELLGYPETKVVEGYRIVTILACALMLTAV